MARAIFIGGTASHAGKSRMATAICRWLRRRGVRVAPFKAQNMSNNSYPCAGGGEIGRAQVAQAEACGLEPETDFNPILLKPDGDARSQVVVNGRVWRDLGARDYYEHSAFLWGEVMAAYERLSQRFDVMVVEGAGSVSEINFRATDLVNLGLARRLRAPALLVADIDRGGVFASVAGTFAVLEPEESEWIRAFAINRFRGDASLFAPGVEYLENKTGRKCLGVFPWLPLDLDEEDAVSLEEGTHAGSAMVAAIRLPHISNFTDLRGVKEVDWITSPPQGRLYRAIVLPGTKNTAGDLRWLRARGLDTWLLRQHAAGAKLIGICGGYQMLGRRVDEEAGLGLLPVETDMQPEKVTTRVRAALPSGETFDAYEIHMGLTRVPKDAVPFARLCESGAAEGIRANGCAGTYLHGAFENAAVAAAELGAGEAMERPSKDEVYDALADWFEQSADVRAFEELFLCS